MTSRARLARALWGGRWGIARLAIAAAALWVLAADTGARLARLQLASLGAMDFAGEVSALRLEGRFGEALAIADAGERVLDRAGDAGALEALRSERARCEQERASWLRRAKEFGLGALSGRGATLEGLLGAISADMLIVGDVRDLVVEGTKLALDGESDELVLGLSALGLATTLTPLDWLPSIVKAARRLGTLGDRLGSALLRLVRAGDRAALAGVGDDLVVLARRGSPGAAVRWLKHADDPKDLRALARFVEGEREGVLVVHALGDVGARAIKGGVEAGTTEARVLVKAAGKGRAGARFLGSGAGAKLLRPHPLVGLAKGLWKGNVGRALARGLERADGQAWWLIPALGSWVLAEVGMLWWRVRGALEGGRTPGFPGGPTRA